MPNFNFPHATAYCKDNRLCVVGMHQTEAGPIAFSASVRVNGVAANGPVDLTHEVSPALNEALSRVQKPILAQIQRDTLRAVSEKLVECARAGDRAALGTLRRVGERARSGEPQAVKTRRVLFDVIRQNPSKV